MQRAWRARGARQNHLRGRKSPGTGGAEASVFLKRLKSDAFYPCSEDRVTYTLCGTAYFNPLLPGLTGVPPALHKGH